MSIKEKKLKVAFCLHGMSVGLNDKHGGLPVTFQKESDLYKENILNENIDVFFHTWSDGQEDLLVETYKPKSYVCEMKKSFVNPTLYWTLKGIYKKLSGLPVELNRFNNIYSRWYSYRRVFEIQKDYSIKNDINYDFVMITRFDLSFFNVLDFSSLCEEKFYVPGWVGYKNSNGENIKEDTFNNSKDRFFKYQRGFPTDDKMGILDFFFIASPKVMQMFVDELENLEALIKETNNTRTSNHKISLKILDKIDKISSIEFLMESGSDFNLTRWT
ncbi:hypothetical protein [Vibrio sp. MA40-2]|uniref:hypothetical protein n=1 Tax=Vibrio sp. MA40-2 TaxID=3391828 RepID=UPI0039A46A16